LAKKQFTYKESGVGYIRGWRRTLLTPILGIVKETHSDAVFFQYWWILVEFFRPNLEGFKKPTFVSLVDGVGN